MYRPTLRRLRAGVGPTSGRSRADVNLAEPDSYLQGEIHDSPCKQHLTELLRVMVWLRKTRPTSSRCAAFPRRAGVGPMSDRRRTGVAPMSDRRRTDVAPLCGISFLGHHSTNGGGAVVRARRRLSQGQRVGKDPVLSDYIATAFAQD